MHLYVHVSLCATFLPWAHRQQRASDLLEFEIMGCFVDARNQTHVLRRTAVVLTAELSLCL